MPFAYLYSSMEVDPTESGRSLEEENAAVAILGMASSQVDVCNLLLTMVLLVFSNCVC